MTDVFDRALLERLLRADLAALADPTQVAAIGLEELAYNALERAGLLRRVGEVPGDLAAALGEARTVEAALEFLRDLSLLDRLEAFLARAAEAEAEPEDVGAGEPLEAPEHVDEAELLFLHRDRVQAAVGETARNLPASKRARSRLARVLADLARFDERWRENLHEFFVVLPLIERLKARFDWRKLDRATHWWWMEIEDAFRRVEAEAGGLEALAREALDEDRCTDALDDVGWQRAAHATGVEFKGRRKFAAHLRRCASCRRAVGDLERLFQHSSVEKPAAMAGEAFALAAAPTAEESLETLRRRVFRESTPILGTPFSVAIGLKEADRLRFTFHDTGSSGYTRKLEGCEVAIEGVGRAPIRGGAAEIALPKGPPIEVAVDEALRAPRTLRLPPEPTPELRALGALVLAQLGREPIRLP